MCLVNIKTFELRPIAEIIEGFARALDVTLSINSVMRAIFKILHTIALDSDLPVPISIRYKPAQATINVTGSTLNCVKNDLNFLLLETPIALPLEQRPKSTIIKRKISMLPIQEPAALTELRTRIPTTPL